MAAVSIAHPIPADLPAGSELSNAELVSRIQAGDQRAFEALFKSQHSALYDFVTRYVGRVTAEEVIQEVFMAIWRRRKTWKPLGELQSYLFAAARNHAISAIRKERSRERAMRQCAAEGIIPGASGFSPVPSQECATRELESACRLAIHDLPEIRRIVMVFRWQYGMTHAKIAFMLGISVKAVEHHITKGLRTLAKRLAWVRA